MRDEPGGLTVTTSSEAAFDHYVAAVDALLAGRTDVDRFIEAALASDEEMALAWVLRSVRERVAGRVSAARTALDRALAVAGSLTDRERSLLAFFDANSRADRFGAERMGLEHLRAYPRDRLVVSSMNFLYNLFLPTADRRERHQALAKEHRSAWGDDWYLLGSRAFIATEAGDHAEARELAERSLEVRPENVPAAHAMAHAVLEMGATSEGQAWLSEWLAAWGAGSTMFCHLTWHHALLVLADGESLAAVHQLEDILAFGHVIALTDGASLMWRLELERWPHPLPWAALEAAPRLPGFTFGTLHRGLVLAGLRRPAAVRTEAATIGGATEQACLALADYVDGNAAGAADRLLTHESDLVTIGGSRAQLEVLDDTLIASLAQSGRVSDAAERLSARVARRPSVRDHRWLTALAEP